MEDTFVVAFVNVVPNVGVDVGDHVASTVFSCVPITSDRSDCYLLSAAVV